jgi:type I restriction enzyme S subunit
MFHKETDFQDTPIGKIPKNWKFVRIKELGELQYGYTASATQENTGTKFLRITDINEDGSVEWEQVPHCYVTGEEFDKYALHKGDLLFARIGATAGKTTYVSESVRGIFASYLIRLKTKKENVHPQFVFYLTQSTTYWSQALRQREGQLKKGINATMLSNFMLPFPPFEEQKKIVGVLGVVDLAVAKASEVIAKTERLKKGLMQTLLTRGIGHKEYKTGKELGCKVPIDWEVIQLNSLIEKGIITYHLDGNHGELYPREEEFVSEGVPFLSANMIADGNIDLNKAKYVTQERAEQFRKGVAKDGDVLFAHNATVGPVAILNTSLPYVILGTTLTSYRCNPDYLDNHYLKYYIESPHFLKQLQRIMKQTTRNQVPITAQRKLHFVIPSMDEQRRIAGMLSTLDRKLDLERKERGKLERVKRGLMDLLLTGKVRIKVD